MAKVPPRKGVRSKAPRAKKYTPQNDSPSERELRRESVARKKKSPMLTNHYGKKSLRYRDPVGNSMGPPRKRKKKPTKK